MCMCGSPVKLPYEMPNECEFRKVCKSSGFVGCWSMPSYRDQCHSFRDFKLEQAHNEMCGILEQWNFDTKSPTVIIDNLTNIIKELNENGFESPTHLKPWWALKAFENECELDNYSFMREKLMVHYGNLYFVGIFHEQELRIIKWYNPDRKTLLELRIPDIKSAIDKLVFNFHYDEQAGKIITPPMSQSVGSSS